jgi:VanZ family protein
MLAGQSDIGHHAGVTWPPKIVFWLPALLWAGLILFLSTIPRIVPAEESVEHKIGHITVFAILGGTVMWALHRGHALHASKALVIATLLTAAYGASDEWHQRYVPGRSCEFSDVVIDTTAGVIAVLAYYLCESIRADHKETSGSQAMRPQASLGPLRKMAYWLPSLSCAALIFFLSSQSRLPEIGRIFPDKDKIEHFVFYLVFWFFILLPLRYAHNQPLTRAIVLAFLITSVYGASNELHRRSTLNRTGIVVDWAADTFGGFIAAAAYWVYETRRSSKTNL